MDVPTGNRTEAPQVSANDYSTLEGGARFIFETHGDTRTETTRMTQIYLRGGDINSYSVSIPSGKGTGTSEVTNRSDFTDYAGALYDFTSIGNLNATEIQIDLNPGHAFLYEVMFMETLFFLENPWTVFNPSEVDRQENIKSNINGNYIKVPGPSRPKWSVDFSWIFHPGKTHAGEALDGETMRRIFNANPNFAIEPSFSKWPDRVFPCTLSGGVNINFLGRDFNQEQLDFTVLEL